MKNTIETLKDFSPVILAYTVLIAGTVSLLHSNPSAIQTIAAFFGR